MNFNIKSYCVDGCAIAFCNDSIHIHGTAEASEVEPGLAYFNRLYVSPCARGKGLAKALMVKLTAQLDANQLDCLCEINPYGNLDYKQLKTFYKKYGFEDYEVEPGAWALLRKHIGREKKT